MIFVGLSWLWVRFLGYCSCGLVCCGLWVAVVGCGFGKPWLWLGLPWVVGGYCGFAVECVFVGFFICCVNPFVLIVC